MHRTAVGAKSSLPITRTRHHPGLGARRRNLSDSQQPNQRGAIVEAGVDLQAVKSHHRNVEVVVLSTFSRLAGRLALGLAVRQKLKQSTGSSNGPCICYSKNISLKPDGRGI